DGTGRPPFSGEILVTGNRIEAVGEANAPLARQRAEVIDCGGATLMPGLVEAHAHLSWPSSVGRIIDAMVLPPEEHLLVTARNARVTLDSGTAAARLVARAAARRRARPEGRGGRPASARPRGDARLRARDGEGRR